MERKNAWEKYDESGKKDVLDFLKNTGNLFLPAKLNANV